ncbi:MAG TPA: hypothetical protein VGM01_07520 [Ktedonobacteraceae bacterium]
MRFSPDERQREQEAAQDGFDLMLRRQGWYLIQHRQVYTDPRVIHLFSTNTTEAPEDQFTALYEAFGENTFRKLLRHIFFHQQGTLSELRRICSGEQKLAQYLDFMREHLLIELEDENWRKGSLYKTINNIGSTLEWYIAEWFRRWLQVPARHGVTIKGVADGGDLDVVAFVDGIRVMVECKSGSPSQITESEIQLFFRRATDFNPEIAVLLIDTDSRIDQQIDILNRLRTSGDPLKAQDAGKNLYWGARHIYVTNTKNGIGESLSAILRLYYSKIRHISFWR